MRLKMGLGILGFFLCGVNMQQAMQQIPRIDKKTALSRFKALVVPHLETNMDVIRSQIRKRDEYSNKIYAPQSTAQQNQNAVPLPKEAPEIASGHQGAVVLKGAFFASSAFMLFLLCFSRNPELWANA